MDTFDLSKVEPVVAKPDFVDNLAPAKDVRGIKIDEAFLGSCNNGRIEDLRVGASIIKGKKVAEKVRFLVVPASQTVYLQALKEGLIDIFMEAGAIVMNPNCSVCWGSCQGVIGENEVLISTGTRNVRYPRNFHFGQIAANAFSAFFFVFRPIAISVVRRTKPNVRTKTR